MEDVLEDMIKINVEQIVSEKIQEEINNKVKAFRDELEDRKDNYISEVMRGIRIYHEQVDRSHEINYKIQFENIYRVEDKQ